jgi:branched-chain amino acid transport system substrate-binding protein
MKTKLRAKLLATAVAVLPAMSHAEEIPVGILLGFTGPAESVSGAQAQAAELAATEVNASGLLLGGSTIKPIRGDGTCSDASAATSVAERMATSDKVAAIFGEGCSGVTIAIVNNVAVSNGITMISPSATSPALTDIADDGYFFRTAPSDARLGPVFAQILLDRGYDEVAVTFSNSDYGRGMADSFNTAYEAAGGKITLSAPHDDGKPDYSAEVGALASAGGKLLVVFGYADQGGLGVVRQSLESGAFDTFAFGDGMYTQTVLDAVGKDIEGTIGAVPWAAGEGAEAFAKIAPPANIDPDAYAVRESYDAMALFALAMQKAGSADRKGIRDAMMDVANAPGEKILPGELAKGLQILKDGGDIDYVGATNVEFDEHGDVQGTFREYVIKDAQYTTVEIR